MTLVLIGKGLLFAGWPSKNGGHLGSGTHLSFVLGVGPSKTKPFIIKKRVYHQQYFHGSYRNPDSTSAPTYPVSPRQNCWLAGHICFRNPELTGWYGDFFSFVEKGFKYAIVRMIYHIPAPSKGYQLDHKGWWIWHPVTEPFGTLWKIQIQVYICATGGAKFLNHHQYDSNPLSLIIHH